MAQCLLAYTQFQRTISVGLVAPMSDMKYSA